MTTTERYIQQCKDFAELMKHYPFTTETLAGEEWRDIEGTDGKYQISNYGRVKSFIHKRPRILKPDLDRCHYLACYLFVPRRRFCMIHRLVAQAFIPNPDDKPEVNHIDGIRWNACVTNLEWVTQSENVKHAYATGLKKNSQGGDSHNAKLTNEQALYIKENPDGLTQHELGTIFNMRQSNISRIQLGLRFRFVGGKIRPKIETYFHKLSPEKHEEIYRLYQTGEYTQKQLGEIFGVERATIGHIIKKLDKEKGCIKRYDGRISDDIRKKVCAEYVYCSKEFGSSALAQKYGCDAATILRIVRNGIVGYKKKEQKPPLPLDVREEIRRIYIKGDPQFGARPLARKYGCGATTIARIINGR